jgi:hypothetical protein
MAIGAPGAWKPFLMCDRKRASGFSRGLFFAVKSGGNGPLAVFAVTGYAGLVEDLVAMGGVAALVAAVRHGACACGEHQHG